jgi:predicted nucleotidyltransferase component of viral defense system
MTEEYRNQVRLLLSVLPIVARHKDLALKGGTALNFFWRDFPRLSVDIDLTYLPVKNRKDSLASISECVQEIADTTKKELPATDVTVQKSGGTLSKLLIRDTDVQIKLEVNTVLRGSIFDSVEKDLSSSIQSEFEFFTALQTLSFEDLYGGKLCAALDRQHPRDLFDVKLLLDNEGITEKIRTAFIGYLISHSRPMNELLNPNLINLDEIYNKEFQGMTNEPVELKELIEVQKELPKLILRDLTRSEKEFIISFKQGNPEWDLMPVSHLKDLPGVRWKLLNIRKMDNQKHEDMLEKLEVVLGANT